MPLFGFTCEGCEASREVLASADRCNGLEFICVFCGATMYLDPVMNIHIKSARADKIEVGAAKAPGSQTGCGHGYACRCAIKLTEPNPFRRQLAEKGWKAEQL